MLKSMTAYGRAEKSHFVVEIHSVNRKSLEMRLYMDKELLRFDLDVRKWIQEKLVRGDVTVRISCKTAKNAAQSTLATLKAAKSAWQKTARALSFDPASIDLAFLLEHAPSEELALSDNTILKHLVQEALKKVMAMKVREGKHLEKDLLSQLKNLEESTARIKKISPKLPVLLLDKLKKRLQDLVPETPENEERYVRELAFYAEKCDIHEEITRLESHFKQFRHYLSSQEKSLGKTFDFLLLEIQREINTLATKAQNSEISHLAVKMKSACEKMREQVQNVE